MILPHGFRRLRLAECTVKIAFQVTLNSLLSGHLFKPPGEVGRGYLHLLRSRCAAAQTRTAGGGGDGGAETLQTIPFRAPAARAGLHLELSLNGDCSELKGIGRWIPDSIHPHRRDAFF